MKASYYNGKYALSKLPDHLGNVKSTLSPARHELVKTIANYCIELRRRYSKNYPVIYVSVGYVKKNTSKGLNITPMRSDSAIYEAVNECLPARFNNTVFCVSAVEINNYIFIET